jgi:hypothetical protein
LSITNDEVQKLLVNYSSNQISDILNDIENYKGNTKYKSLYLTAVKWLQKNQPTIRRNISRGNKSKKIWIY